jgi:hypothetical protein
MLLQCERAAGARSVLLLRYYAAGACSVLLLRYYVAAV